MNTPEPWASNQYPRRSSVEAPREPRVEVFGALWIALHANGIVIGVLNAAAMRSFRRSGP